MEHEQVSAGWGGLLRLTVKTETRDFLLVEKALADSGMQDFHAAPLLHRPSMPTAFARAMNYLGRVCQSSIPFPQGSPNAEWEESGVTKTGDRNPNYSLKIESLKTAASDTSVSYRINISDRRVAGQDMAHVLTATYADGKVTVGNGTHAAAYAKYGGDLTRLVDEAYIKFRNNYDDTDIRAVAQAELNKLKAISVLGGNTNFIAKDSDRMPMNAERSQKLAGFLKETGHLVALFGLDASAMTRDQLVDELKESLLSEMNEFEKSLDDKLNSTAKERSRGDAQRNRMKTTADQTIDRIMSLADYHAEILGVMAEGIRERAATLRAKANEFLTRDFGKGTPGPKVESAKDKRIKELEAALAVAEAARKQRVQDYVAATTPTGEVESQTTPPSETSDIEDPFNTSELPQ